MKKKYIIICSILFLFLLQGCISVNEEFAKLKDKVLSSSGNKYETTAQFSVGSVGITLSSWIINIAQDEEYITEMMSEIDNVQVGIYERISESATPGYKTLLEINSDMESAGWKYIFRSMEDDELSAVYLRAGNDNLLERLYFISFEDEQLVLVELEGDLAEVISILIEEKGLKFSSAVN